VRIGPFAQQFIAFNKRPRSTAELASALTNSEKQHDVVILKSEFDSFCERHGDQPVAKGGRPAKESWKSVAQILARVVLSAGQFNKKTLVTHLISEMRKARVSDQPGTDSLEDLIKAAAKS
jgi:hypothetical protein